MSDAEFDKGWSFKHRALKDRPDDDNEDAKKSSLSSRRQLVVNLI